MFMYRYIIVGKYIIIIFIIVIIIILIMMIARGYKERSFVGWTVLYSMCSCSDIVAVSFLH